MRTRSQWFLLWLALFGVYAATIGIDASPGQKFSADEAHYLLTAESLTSDGDIDLTDEYRTEAYSEWHSQPLIARGQTTGRQINEPHGVGFPLLIAPAYALGGPLAVQLLLAAFAALAVLFALTLARRLVPQPWASVAPLVCAVALPVLALSTAIYPEIVAAAVVAGAAVLTLKARKRPRARYGLGVGALCGLLPWLAPQYTLIAAVIAGLTFYRFYHTGRRVTAYATVELLLISVVVYISFNRKLFGGLTPLSAGMPSDDPLHGSALEILERGERLVTLWLSPDYGLLPWASFFVLAFAAIWLLWRSRSEHLSRIIGDQGTVEASAVLLLSAVAAQLLAAVFLTVSAVSPFFPGQQLIAVAPLLAALCAWVLRHLRRTGTALAVITLGISISLYIVLRLGETWSDVVSAVT